MTSALEGIVDDFILGKITAQDFSDRYIDRWRFERNSGELKQYKYEDNGVMSSIFCIADMYSPNHNRREDELNETQLKEQVIEEFKKLTQRSPIHE